MSEMTLQLLLSFDAVGWHEASDRWRRVAQAVDAATDRLIGGTRDLGFAWPAGAGSAAAFHESTAVLGEVDNTYGPARRIQQAMDEHAYAMSALRQQAASIIAAARQAGYTVDTAAMTITAPASAYLGANLDRTGRETGGLLNDLRSVVEYARAQDDATARVINDNVPSAGIGFGTSPPGAIVRAQELARKLKDPTHEPTAAELDELRDLIQTYGKDRVFAFGFLDALGPKGLLELSGTLATYQLDQPGRDVDNVLFDRDRAAMVRDLQNGLGAMLATATEPSGITGGLRGEDYVRGEYELSSQWVMDLMTAGRMKMDIGDPSSPMRYVEDVYGYQLLSPLLHNGGLDPGFVATVGGDIVDFEMEQGKGSDLWTEGRGENVRLDWTQGHDDNAVPAGYDPVNALMDGLSRNGEGARDLFTGVTESSTDPRAPDGGRLPHLDYLLTDRDWRADTPGGPGWTAEVLQHGDEYRKSGLDDLGVALERATLDHPGPAARHLVEAIVYESSVDEKVTAAAATDAAAHEQKQESHEFMKTDVIPPEMRDSMARIMSGYIADVNGNIADADYGTPESIDVDRQQLVRFLADIGKDEAAHDIVARAEAGYGAAAYDYVLSGRQHPGAELSDNLNAMKVVSQNYGGVMGALDMGAVEADIETSAQLDEKTNTSIETRYKVIGPLIEGAVGAATARVPGASDLINGYVGEALEGLEEWEKSDSSGQARYQAGEVLGAGRTSAVLIAEGAFYESGRLENLPSELIDESGDLKPMDTWAGEDISAWRDYKRTYGLDTVGAAGTEAGNAYQLGYDWARATLTPDVPKGGASE
ncbi:hypothetical protein [Actinoplanes philippinensis]|uniref:hypothetical protein n=1 Tax=Actinoplanes philippinensis TaxID=35752 RepID=UPI0033F3DACF